LSSPEDWIFIFFFNDQWYYWKQRHCKIETFPCGVTSLKQNN